MGLLSDFLNKPRAAPVAMAAPSDWLNIPGVTYKNTPGTNQFAAVGKIGKDFQIPQGISRAQLDALYAGSQSVGGARISEGNYAPATPASLSGDYFGAPAKILAYGRAQGWYPQSKGSGFGSLLSDFVTGTVKGAVGLATETAPVWGAALGGVLGAPAVGAAAAPAVEGAGMTTAEMIAAHAAIAPELFPGAQLAASFAPASAIGAVAGQAPALLGPAEKIAAPAALDPIAAPVSEALPPAAAAAPVGGGPSAAPSVAEMFPPASGGNPLGLVKTFGESALAIGGLLGGLAGLQGGGNPNMPEAPPPAPPGAQYPTQADARQALTAGSQRGGPFAGNASTWLTGASGIPEDQLNLGRSTLLGQ